jgi:hypothetical protein
VNVILVAADGSRFPGTTDSDGNVRFDNVPAGTATLEFEGDDYVPDVAPAPADVAPASPPPSSSPTSDDSQGDDGGEVDELGNDDATQALKEPGVVEAS